MSIRIVMRVFPDGTGTTAPRRPFEEDELEVGSRDEPRAALRSLASGRLRFVLFKRGARGGILARVAAELAGVLSRLGRPSAG